MITYRKDIVEFFKKAGFALSKVSEVKVGQTYYTNSFRDGKAGFKIDRLLSDKEHWEVWNESMGQTSESMFAHTDDIAWFEVAGEDGGKSWHSLSDCNIGASYNPWLVFTTKESLDAYNLIQEIGYERDYLDEMFDDYEYENEE